MTELPIDENTPRILIVEDEPKLGQLLIDYLRAAIRYCRMCARHHRI